jgi:NAD(P)-dependent dehydrogenase (short-subunit alcohol dehydrogenase family)
MHGFTKALALEVARKGVTVNTISPGCIGTKMVMAIPHDVLEIENSATDSHRAAREARGNRGTDHLLVLRRGRLRQPGENRD